MVRDLKSPYVQIRREGTSLAILLNQLDVEEKYMVERGYSEQQRFINIRPISFYYCQMEQYTDEPIVGYLALTYHDRYLSKHIDIPVVMQGEGFEANLHLFVFSCVTIACSEMNSNFDFSEFLDTHHVADDHCKVKLMEFQIKKGLEGRVIPFTAFNPILPLISLLEMEDQQELELVHYVFHTILTINTDIKFTELRPSTLTASVILVVCYKLYPGLHHRYFKKIFRSGYVQKSEVKECFDELKDYVLVDYIFIRDKCPKVVSGNVPCEQGKELLIDDDAPFLYEYLPNNNHPLEFFIEDHEDFLEVFREEQQNRKHKSDKITEEEEDQENKSVITEEQLHDTSEITTAESEPELKSGPESESESESEPELESESEPVEEERYGLMQRVLICLCPLPFIRCFGYENGRGTSN